MRFTSAETCGSLNICCKAALKGESGKEEAGVFLTGFNKLIVMSSGGWLIGGAASQVHCTPQLDPEKLTLHDHPHNLHKEINQYIKNIKSNFINTYRHI